MPMQLLQQLAMLDLPVEVHGDEVEKVIVLQEENLIAAEIGSDITPGLRRCHATVLTVTPAGRRAATSVAPQLET